LVHSFYQKLRLLFLALIILLSVLPFAAVADDTTNIIRLTSTKDFLDFYATMNEHDYKGKVIQLAGDIDLTGAELPTGEQVPFQGTFDGQNHTIIGFSNKEWGLFSTLGENGTITSLIMNMAVEGITDENYGCLANMCYGTISLCQVTGYATTISTISTIGGIVGVLMDSEDYPRADLVDCDVSKLSNKKIDSSLKITDKNVSTTIRVKAVTLSDATLSVRVGDVFQLTYKVKPTNATNKRVSFSSSDSAVAVVDNKGLVTACKAGNATITITTANGKKTDTTLVTVIQPAIGISLNKSNLYLPLNTTAALVATLSPADVSDKNLQWSSTNENVASVDNNGNILAKETGITNVSVATTDGSVNAQCVVQVIIPIESVFLDYDHTIQIGDMFTIPHEIKPTNATIQDLKWESSDSSLATVDSSGNVTAIKMGNVVITARSQDDSNMMGECIVHLVSPIDEFSLNKYTLTLNSGDVETLVATIKPESATSLGVDWISTDPAIATVDTNGMVTAHSKGTTFIIVGLPNDGRGRSSATCKVIVDPD
jgi:uncharacterized protein YjdB